MTISFRTRLIAVAALVVTGVLSAVLALVWSNVRRVEFERLEARLCLEARRLASQRFDVEEAGRLEVDVMGKLRLGDPTQLMLRIEPIGAPAYLSAQWRAGPRIDDLHWAPMAERKGELASEPPRPEHPPPGGNKRTPAPPALPGPPPRTRCSLASFEYAGARWHAALVAGPEGRGVVAADAAAAADELLAVLRGTLGIVVPLALGLVAIGAWLLSAVSMRPVSRLREAMKSVSQKDLSRRLESRNEDREFQELIGAYNAMLERLQASFEQASRFSADAAHELRTPLTILQGRLEQAIHKSEKRAIQSDLTDMLDELGRLAGVTRKLLLLSQADAGHLALHRKRVDLTDLLGTLVNDAQMLVTDQTVTSAIEPGLSVNGDALLLRQLLNNLVSNAVRYCKPGGWITIAGHRRHSAVEITFANSAEPIPSASRAQLFDRFYRLDPARSRQSEGTGLGLSLAREIARAHGGDLTLEPGPADAVKLKLQLPFE
jgi:two-component system, OmpR family, heavy metal sensor histidine kinase CusS